MRGHEADLMIWEPDSSFLVTEADIQHRHKVCPYTGMELFGKVKKTIVRGFDVYDNGRFLHLGHGNLLMGHGL